MKRLIWILLALLLLAGCAGEETPVPVEKENTVPATESVGIYMANSSVEQQTGGAIRVYVPEDDTCIGMVPMDGYVVLVSNLNKLTLMDRETGELGVSIKVEDTISCAEGDFTATGSGVSYYCGEGRELVFLNSRLQQTARVEIPEDISGNPYVSHTNQEVYYCKDKQVRALDLVTGISRLVKEQACQSMELVGGYLDGTMLCCKVTEENGTERVVYLDSATGQTLDDTNQISALQTGDNHYLVTRTEGIVTQRIFGAVDGTPQLFTLGEPVTAAFSLGGAYSWRMENNALELDYYDFETGTLSAQTRMVGVSEPVSIGADDKYIWILAKEAGKDTLYRWDVSLSQTGNTESFVSALYTRESPDTQGLAACAERAKLLGEEHGIHICVAKDALEIAGEYTLVDEFQVQAIDQMLDRMKTILDNLPSDFLRESLAKGELHVGLVRSIDDGTREMVQFYEDGNAYVLLAVNDNLEENFLHGVGYLIDSHVLGNSRDYDTWKQLNPSGFDYDYNYFAYTGHGDSKYLTDENRAFTDAYAMTYPHEDRCRLFVHAVLEGNGHLFTTDTMQAKLKRMCQGIRESYGYEKDGKTYIWEQYLNTSLANKNN